jgi:acetyltransferase-like isoleucine patch superfamily enzyme
VVVLAFEGIEIEDDVALASEVFVTDSDNHPLGDRPMRQAPVVIGRGAWVATRATILAGVRIGERAVVAAGAVVTSDVPADTLVAGVPARPVRTLTYHPGQVAAWKAGDLACG